MKKIAFHFIALLSVTACYAQDTIIFKNGDALTGEILQQDSDRIYFKSPAFGSVSLNTKDIEEIRFEAANLGEVTIPADVLAPEPEVKTLPEVAPAKPAAPKSASKKPKKSAWKGQAGLAVAMRETTRSNNSGVTSAEKYETYNLYGNIDWKGENNKLRWDWTYRYSRNEVSLRDDYFNITQKYSHDFKENYYATTKTVYQRDYKRKIEHEYLQTAEVGVKWFDSSKFQLSTSAGGGYHKYHRTSSSIGELSIAQPKFIFDQSVRWELINSLTLIQKYTHLGDLTDYHFVFSAGLENKLINDVFLRLEYKLDRDTEVYYDDRGYDDKALLTSVLYKF